MNESEKALNEILMDVQKEYAHSNRTKNKIIILLIVLMFAEAVIGYSGFVWYESQFEYVTTEAQTTTSDIDLNTEGDNANAEYNNVEGNQYNDSATHNEGGVE